MRWLGALTAMMMMAACVPVAWDAAPPAMPAEPAAPTSMAAAPGEAANEMAVEDALPALPEAPPELAREFRAVWVATVGNIDWPSKPGLPADQQKVELLRILDDAAAMGLNAVIFQVRPAADALYASSIEPWSEYLSGTMGAPPEPYYDPLEFAVREAHLRGLELHAWFNPYRARHPSGRSAISGDHLSRLRPDLVKRYGSHLWMDPGEAEVQDRTVEVILDVVRRYDIDGVHLDDYFYPYQERDRQRRIIPFPDEDSYRRYRNAGGALARDDWRRENVNDLVARIYSGIKAEKPWVKFGISPFGIWRPGHPESVRGLDAYATLYADARLWLANGWVDYFTPQLYWRISAPQQSYPALLEWWAQQNAFQRHLWPGNYISRVGDSQQWPAEEILSQVEVTRRHPGASGNVLFSMKTLLGNQGGLRSALIGGPYREQALVPASPWLSAAVPGPPRLSSRATSGLAVEVTIEPSDQEPVRWWAVQTLEGGAWQLRLVSGEYRTLHLPSTVDWVVVRGVNRSGVEGEMAYTTTRGAE